MLKSAHLEFPCSQCRKTSGTLHWWSQCEADYQSQVLMLLCASFLLYWNPSSTNSHLGPVTQFPSQLFQDVDLQTSVHIWLMHDTAQAHFNFAIWKCLNVFSGTMDKTRLTDSMACSFPWFESLRFLSLGASKVYCLCSKSQWCPRIATTNTEWSWDDFYDTSKSGNHSSDVQCYVLKLKLNILNIFFNHQEAITKKSYFRRPLFM